MRVLIRGVKVGKALSANSQIDSLDGAQLF